jgi:hypothetical protein
VTNKSVEQLKGLYLPKIEMPKAKPASADVGGDVEKVEVGAGKTKKKKEKKAPSQMPDLDRGLDQLKIDHEKKNASDGMLTEFPIEKEKEYWAHVLATRKLSANDRLSVEKKLSDAQREIRQRDHDARKNELDKELSLYQNNYAKRLEKATDLALHMEFAYGKESKQAKAAQGAIESIKREAAKKDADMRADAIKASEAHLLAEVEFARQSAQQQLDMGLITQREMLAREQSFENQRYEIKRRSLDDRLALWDEENQRTKDGDPAARQNITDERTTLDADHQKNTGDLGGQMQMANMERYFGGLSDTMSSLWDRGLESMIKGTLTWKNATQAIWADMSSFFLKKLITDPLKEEAFAAGRRMLMKLGFIKAETAAETAGQAAKTGAAVAGETARTGVTATGVMMRLALKVGEVLKSIAMYAWEAMAAAWAAISSIPIIGPVLAPVVAGATFAGVAALAGKVASASGGYDIPTGVNPMTQLHQEEMVLPAKYANVIRGMAAGDGQSAGNSAAMPNINVNVHALDAKSVTRLLKDNRSGLAAAIRAGVRDFKPLGG